MQTSSRMATAIILGRVTRRAFIVIAIVCCLTVHGTVVGQAVPSWPVDPLMTAKDESRILRLMGQTIAPPANGIPLRTMVETLPTELPITIDDRALDEIGMSAEDPIEVRLHHPAPLIVHLLSVLHQLELTIGLQHNLLTITTQEQYENDYPVRVYDVTELTNPPRRYQIQELEDAIQVSIAPDSWSALGGLGTFTPQLSVNKTHLVIANSTFTHLRIDTFLNRIAGNRDYQPFSVKDSQSKSNYDGASPRSSVVPTTPVQSGLVNFANPSSPVPVR